MLSMVVSFENEFIYSTFITVYCVLLAGKNIFYLPAQTDYIAVMSSKGG